MNKEKDLGDITRDNPKFDRPEEALDFILSNAFRSGFGALSKTDLDLILFAAIVLHSDKNSETDFQLSKYLQITQQRVRNLREKVSVKFPSIDREKAIRLFLEKTKKARVDDKFIEIPVNDVAIKNEIEAILDEKDVLLHTQLNPKIFRLRIDDFLDVMVYLEAELNKSVKPDNIYKNLLEEIKKKAEKNDKFKEKITAAKSKEGEITVKSLKWCLMKGGVAFGIDILASLVPGGAIFSGPIKELIETLAKDRFGNNLS